jgi:hypothetical protein
VNRTTGADDDGGGDSHDRADAPRAAQRIATTVVQSARGLKDERVAPECPATAAAANGLTAYDWSHFKIASTSAMDCHRASGSLLRHRRITHSSSGVAVLPLIAGGSEETIAAMRAAGVGASNARRPVAIS